MSVRALGLAPSLRHAMLPSKLSSTGGALGSLALSSRTAPRSIALALSGTRPIQTESLPPSAADGILNAQRLKRPSSPHFTIYQPQLTWVGSIAHRVAGAGLGVLLYGSALAYLAAGSAGLGSAGVVVAAVAGLPAYVKVAGKVVVAAPAAYHAWNGVRHLAWDLGKFVNVKGAYRTGYAVLGATVLSTVYLVWP